MTREFKGNIQKANDHGSVRIGITKDEAADVGLEPGQRAVFKLVEIIDE